MEPYSVWMQRGVSVCRQARQTGLPGQNRTVPGTFQIHAGTIIAEAAGKSQARRDAANGRGARLVGHAVGGVCPFGVNPGVKVYLDESLKRFETVFPAAGSSNSAIELTIPELERYSGCTAWVDVCKNWQPAEG